MSSRCLLSVGQTQGVKDVPAPSGFNTFNALTLLTFYTSWCRWTSESRSEIIKVRAAEQVTKVKELKPESQLDFQALAPSLQ